MTLGNAMQAVLFALRTGMVALPLVVFAAEDQPLSIDDARFGRDLGASIILGSDSDSPVQPYTSSTFRGNTGRSCANLDLHTFLTSYNAHELLAELRESLLSGAQSAVYNYLLALAYSAPTITSILDVADHQLAGRFNAFAQTCANQQARFAGGLTSDRRLSQAADQCFAREIAHGISPTEAYRQCSVARSFNLPPLPATLSTVEFLRQHCDIALTPRIESLLQLLPDGRIEDGRPQIRPPQTTLASLSEALQSRSKLAVGQLLDGASPRGVLECPSEFTSTTAAMPCLPRSAFPVVGSPAFSGARLLGPTARSMFAEALASQFAVVDIYSGLLDLTRRVSQMNLRPDSDADVTEFEIRQGALHNHLRQLLDTAALQVKLQELKSGLARTQVLALERAEADLQTVARALQLEQDQSGLPLAPKSMVHLFQSSD